MPQLDLFQKPPLSGEEFDYGKGEIKEARPTKEEGDDYCTRLMATLDQLTLDAENINKTLKGLIDEIQSDWSEDEKLQINDPKEWQRRQQENPKEKPIMPVSQDIIDSLKRCRVEGNTLFLPPISEGPLVNYSQVRQVLLNAGATYKKNTFVFKSDAQPFIDRLTSGESVNIKKEFQFFATPADVADWLVELARIEDGMCVLEPSAGQGAIIEAIYRRFPRYMKGPNEDPCVTVDFFEFMPENRQVLSKRCNSDQSWGSRTSWMGDDFLNPTQQHIGYHRIIANPPFSKNQDIDHIYQMWKHLLPGGILVSVASKHWNFSSNKKEKKFREWINKNSAVVHSLDRGRFKESGTMAETCVIVIQKKN